jgi:hypothetical protein
MTITDLLVLSGGLCLGLVVVTAIALAQRRKPTWLELITGAGGGLYGTAIVWVLFVNICGWGGCF